MSDDRTTALPERFAFFHLGEVELLPLSSEDVAPLSSLTMIGFRLDEGLGGWLLIGVPPNVDESTYCELGNVIASRYATRLGLMISPPERLSPARAARLVSTATGRWTYRHRFDGGEVPVETWLTEGVENA